LIVSSIPRITIVDEDRALETLATVYDAVAYGLDLGDAGDVRIQIGARQPLDGEVRGRAMVADRCRARGRVDG
jgi:hypothetical protein